MRLSVPKPCHEDWNKMTLNEQGAFCKVCAKTVVDFSTMSDEEVLNYFKNKGEEKTCGRFKASQLAPYEFKVDIRRIARGRFPKIFAASVFIFFTSLFVCKSDTGQVLPVSVLVDSMDTTALKLPVVDTTTHLNSSVTVAIDTVHANGGKVTEELLISGGLQATIPKSTELLTGDTVYTIDTAVLPLSPDLMSLPIMGAVAIDYRQPHSKPPTCVKKPPRKNDYVMGKMVKGEVYP
jgi:hypothetical protein